MKAYLKAYRQNDAIMERHKEYQKAYCQKDEVKARRNAKRISKIKQPT